MLSKTAEYALQAVVAIATEEEGRRVLAREIRSKGHIPQKYLSKVLRDLVHAGVLEATRGIGGGFRLRRRANKIRLIDVIKPFDDPSAISRCPLACSKCSDRAPCAIHDKMRPIRTALRTLLEDTTIAQLVVQGKQLQTAKRR